MLTLLERVGRGGFAEAWTVRMEGKPDPVIGKFLHAQAMAKGRLQGSAERMRTEIRLLSLLDLPGVPRLEGHGEQEGLPYLLMQRVYGCTWRELMRNRTQPLPLKTLWHCCLDLAGIVGALHERGIVHSDLKPDNLLFGRTGDDNVFRSWVIDFGLAREVGTSVTRITTEGQTVGTHGYLDPRHIERALERDAAGDVYALGATWYEWYAGKPLFSDAQWHRMLRAYREASSASCEEAFNEHVTLQLNACVSLPRHERDEGFEALLRSMLLYESTSHIRPSMREIERALLAIAHPRWTHERWERFRGNARTASRTATDPADAMMRLEALCETQGNKTKTRTIAGMTAAVTVAIAALLSAHRRPAEEPAIAAAHEPALEIKAAPPPQAPPSALCMAIDEKTLRIAMGPDIVLSANLQSSPQWGSALRPGMTACSIHLEAPELCALLEKLKKGSSAGLPKRLYTLHCSCKTEHARDDIVLMTPRGVLQAREGITVFHPNESLDDEAAESLRKHLGSWPLSGKLLDTAIRIPQNISADEAQKAMTRANDALRLLQQKALIRPKTVRQPKQP
jgi:serine/threonine protein kinase